MAKVEVCEPKIEEFIKTVTCTRNITEILTLAESNSKQLAQDKKVWVALLENSQKFSTEEFDKILNALFSEPSAFNTLITIDPIDLSNPPILNTVIGEALAHELEGANLSAWNRLSFRGREIWAVVSNHFANKGNLPKTPTEEVFKNRLGSLYEEGHYLDIEALFESIEGTLEKRFKVYPEILLEFYRETLAHLNDCSKFTGEVLAKVIEPLLAYSKEDLANTDIAPRTQDALQKFQTRVVDSVEIGNFDRDSLDTFHICALCLYGISLGKRFSPLEFDIAKELHLKGRDIWGEQLNGPSFTLPENLSKQYVAHKNELLFRPILERALQVPPISVEDLKTKWQMIKVSKIHFQCEAELICKATAVAINRLSNDPGRSIEFALTQLERLKGSSLTKDEFNSFLSLLRGDYFVHVLSYIGISREEISDQINNVLKGQVFFNWWRENGWVGIKVLPLTEQGRLARLAREMKFANSTELTIYEEIGLQLGQIETPFQTYAKGVRTTDGKWHEYHGGQGLEKKSRIQNDATLVAEILAAQCQADKRLLTLNPKDSRLNQIRDWQSRWYDFQDIAKSLGYRFTDAGTLLRQNGTPKFVELTYENLLLTAPSKESHENVAAIAGKEVAAFQDRFLTILAWQLNGFPYIDSLTIGQISRILAIPLGVSRRNMFFSEDENDSDNEEDGSQELMIHKGKMAPFGTTIRWSLDFAERIRNSRGQEREAIKNLLANVIDLTKNKEHLRIIEKRVRLSHFIGEVKKLLELVS